MIRSIAANGLAVCSISTTGKRLESKDSVFAPYGETPDTDKSRPYGLPRQLSTLPGFQLFSSIGPELIRVANRLVTGGRVVAEEVDSAFGIEVA